MPAASAKKDMQVVRDPSVFHTKKPLHMAVGMFDGVHIGHQAVVESAIHAARAKEDVAGVLTFSPHPSQILRPQNPTLLIQTEAQKEERLRGMGLDLLAWQTFTLELAAVPAREYVRKLKAHFPKLASMYVGENFRFGKGREGDISTMLSAALEQGVHVISIERVRYDGEPVSSTRIRALICDGHIEEANSLLGYNYYCTGKVEGGRQLGHKLGFPTLNIPWQPQCRPRYGVYAVRVRRVGQAEGAALPGVANYGLRPTVETDASEPLLETHLLAPCPFGPGDALRVEWLQFIRPEKQFATVEMLKAQIAEDCRRVKELANNGNAQEQAYSSSH